jgi:hypothetical protein
MAEAVTVPAWIDVASLLVLFQHTAGITQIAKHQGETEPSVRRAFWRNEVQIRPA